MDKEPVGVQNTEIARNLPLMASELLLWPHSQICVITGEFDDNQVNYNEFEGYCNGYFNEYEEDAITAALYECDNSKNQFDLSLPLVISAKAHSKELNEILVPTVLYMTCGATSAWKYELSAGFENGKVTNIHIFTRDENGAQTQVYDKSLEKLFAVIGKVLSNRLVRTGKVEFVIR